MVRVLPKVGADVFKQQIYVRRKNPISVCVGILTTKFI